MYKKTMSKKTELKIRHATIEDAKKISELENICFPFAEAASEESIFRRVKAFPNHFWLGFDGDNLVSFVNGLATNQKDLTDEMYENENLHDESGNWQMIFGVDTAPDYRKRGFASQVMETAISDSKRQKRKGLVLTCKEKLIPFYERFGFKNEGLSSSEHGGVKWYQMRLEFKN